VVSKKWAGFYMASKAGMDAEGLLARFSGIGANLYWVIEESALVFVATLPDILLTPILRR